MFNIYFNERIPVYGLMIIISIFIGLIYILINMKDEIKKDYRLIYFFVLPIPFVISFGFFFTMIVNRNFNMLENGLSSYGGLIGLIVSAIVFYKMVPNKNIIKYSIISLPLIYSISKLGCFFAGCCYGIHYYGPFNASYGFEEVYNVLPIPMIETITFFISFLIINRFKNNKNIIEYTIIGCALLKGLLDFLRIDHEGIFLITPNQIFSVILIIIGVVLLFIKEKKHERK